ncbi:MULTISPECIES: maleylpyruvate isomerase family mycothiol-dependent enzyme [unclassified Amycolatopsis]|uniref:maleylpyruvate isomerase family mycothiol-dependent enzyme n=1 Tax=unclassified Amycolatopsis TaxID=2618356 RepID=UPI002875EA58|nr:MULTISPECIES: maleylpyruvate isomerase family mycothiol-dependent enzyme [unclassified Amycolatopsis]MDS0136375.1 maleylpyruvate isomerase family mycothiol-dependent enzyme [Amycolatopsis sp. 505]MDS0145890.1 maleylpyruvate isomerase family mycothiol-dependent enzyme [Amycolatopsis sp. CM201R]
MTTMPFRPRDYVPVLAGLTGAFAEALRTADPAAAVSDCAGWTVADLATHLGNVHRWAATVVRTGEVHPQDFTAGPETDLVPWYAESARLLLGELEAADPADPCWHFGGTGKTKAFWFRRQVHETAVHLADLGGDPALDPAVAADGVDEVFTAMLPRVTRWHAVPRLPGPVTVRATDTGDVWTVHPGEPPALGAAVAGGATVEAPARALLLRLWKRTGPDPRATGAAAEALLAAPLTP